MLLAIKNYKCSKFKVLENIFSDDMKSAAQTQPAIDWRKQEGSDSFGWKSKSKYCLYVILLKTSIFNIS